MIFTPSSFLFTLFYFAIHCHLQYSFLLICSSLLSTSSLTLLLAFPPLLSSVYPGSARGICTVQLCWAATSPSYCFVLDYMFMNQVLSFPLPLCYCECSASLYHTGQNSCYPGALTTTLPSTQPLATTVLADTILLRVFMVHTVPYINFVWGYRLSFEFLNPEDGNDRLS